MIEQGTTEWFQQRCGKVTASRVYDVMSSLKSGKPSAARVNYAAELVAEIMTGKPADSFDNAAMRWGRECEPLARSAYEAETGQIVQLAGFVDHPTISNTGASPDGYVNDNALIELKCPNTATHIETLLNNEIPVKYQYQMLWQLECTQREWCDFVSFDPRLPPELQLFIKRFERDDERLENIRDEIVQFLDHVNSVVIKLKNIRSQQGNVNA